MLFKELTHELNFVNFLLKIDLILLYFKGMDITNIYTHLKVDPILSNIVSIICKKGRMKIINVSKKKIMINIGIMLLN